MNVRRGQMALGIGAALVLLVLGGVGGMALDRMRFEPERAAFLAQVEAVVRVNQGMPLAVGAAAPVHMPR